MAEGYLDQSTGSISPERLGHDYFEKLLSRSFFQHAPNGESMFVMHDLMNDLATFVAGNFFLRFDNQMDMKKEDLEKYRHMSFIREQFVGYKRFEPFRSAKSLRTLIAVHVGVKQSWEHFYLSNKILVDLLPELLLLRVLNLSCFDISEVPESIGRMKHLRYLNLSKTLIEELPESVGNLYNLETLIAFGCKRLRKLPSSFLKLKSLRHFDIYDTPLLKKMSLGIGELKGLQTLTNIIIEGGNGFAITELKELHNLHGKMSLMGLDNVKMAKHVHDANLSQKTLTELELEWGDVFRNDILEKEVMDMLKPRNDQLKKLAIACYGGIEFPNWVGDPSFLQLTYVMISCCSKCTFLPPLGKLPLLKELYIEGMDGVKVVGFELLGTGVAFRKLEVLCFEKMSEWEVWTTESGVLDHVVFPCLEVVCIKDCPNLVQVSLNELPSLKVLYIQGCDSDVLRSMVHAASSITELKINNISRLIDEVWISVMECLGAVEEIKMYGCNEIRYLWESEAQASKFLTNLRKLEVRNCSKLVRLGEKEDDDCGSNLLPSLRVLKVFGCESMECCSCPNSIEDLSIHLCYSITSVSFRTSTQKLKSLVIDECEKLMGNELVKLMNNTSHMPMLEVVSIWNWSNLKSVIGLSYNIHLTKLEIGKCHGMESFPDLQLSKLTSLKDMTIRFCKGMDASFPRGLWPPNLTSLEIGELKKPMSEWGPQNFPTSLTRLFLYGAGDDVSSCSQLSEFLPSSLTSLLIVSFEELESVSMGFQHLTSLQHLYIENCPKIKGLSHKLYPSLLSLKIRDCPNLKEKTSTNYWARFSHISCIDIS